MLATAEAPLLETATMPAIAAEAAVDSVVIVATSVAVIVRSPAVVEILADVA